MRPLISRTITSGNKFWSNRVVCPALATELTIIKALGLDSELRIFSMVGIFSFNHVWVSVSLANCTNSNSTAWRICLNPVVS